MAIFFTADTHFGHEKVIGYSNRPFANAAEMDEALLANWRAVVKPNDKVYHLGDVAFGNEEKVTRIAGLIRKLPGQKFLIPGNHDSARNLKIFFIYEKAFDIPGNHDYFARILNMFEHEKGFDIKLALPQRFELDINGIQLPKDVPPPPMRGEKRLPIVLDHYPLMSWNRSGHGALHLHGHCHACVPATNQRLDVGVDAWNYAPASLEDVLRHLAAAPRWDDPRAALRDASPLARLRHWLCGR